MSWYKKIFMDQGEVWIHPGPLLKEVKYGFTPPQWKNINKFFFLLKYKWLVFRIKKNRVWIVFFFKRLIIN